MLRYLKLQPVRGTALIRLFVPLLTAQPLDRRAQGDDQDQQKGRFQLAAGKKDGDTGDPISGSADPVDGLQAGPMKYDPLQANELNPPACPRRIADIEWRHQQKAICQFQR